MPRFTTLEKVELAAIPVAIGAAVLTPAAWLPGFRVGGWITAGALLLLGQGFCRDVLIWFALHRAKNPSTPRYAQCMCVESAVGMTAILGAAGLTAFGFGPLLAATQPGFTLGVTAILVVGFLIKDFVFEWSPWRVYREKDHATLHFRWKR